MHNLINQALQHHNLPGLAVVIRQHNQDLFTDGTGQFDANAQLAVTKDSQYGVASLSKLITTVLALLLQEKNALSLNDRLSEHFPALNIARNNPITLTHLLNHTSGFPGLPSRFYAHNIDNPSDRSGGIGRANARHAVDPLPNGLPNHPSITTATELVELLNHLDITPLAAPGDLLNYSNESFCLLGGILERATGRPYAELVHDLILKPLQMNQTAVGTSSGNEVALPLIRNGNNFEVSQFWKAPLFYPAGGIISSANDIARLVGALSNSSNLLSNASRKQLLTPTMPVASRPVPGIAYSLGLEYQQIDSATTMLWHSGQRAGVSSFMGWLVEDELAISVLCNVADAPVTSIAHQLVGDVLNRSDIAWPPEALTQPTNTRPTANFIGSYASDEGNRYDVKRVADDLVLTGRNGHAATMQFSGPDYGIVGDQTFRFLTRDGQSESWAIALDLRVVQRSG